MGGCKGRGRRRQGEAVGERGGRVGVARGSTFGICIPQCDRFASSLLLSLCLFSPFSPLFFGEGFLKGGNFFELNNFDSGDFPRRSVIPESSGDNIRWPRRQALWNSNSARGPACRWKLPGAWAARIDPSRCPSSAGPRLSTCVKQTIGSRSGSRWGRGEARNESKGEDDGVEAAPLAQQRCRNGADDSRGD